MYYDISGLFKEAVQRGYSVYDYKNIEYPPLAVLWMAAPGLSLRADHFSYESWKRVFKIWYLLFDIVVFVTILYVRENFYGKPKNFLGPVLYILYGLFLLNFIYDRQDLWLGGVIFLAVLALIFRVHWSVPWILLAIGINFKLVPILLIPVFLLGSLPAHKVRSYRDLLSKGLLMDISKKALVLLGSVLLVFLPFYTWGGEDALYFLSYHKDRGLQLESTYSAVLMALNHVGIPVSVNQSYGAYNLESSLAGYLAKFSPLLLVLMMLYLFFIMMKCIIERANKHHTIDTTASIAQRIPQSFILISMATLLGSICVSKVLSPQYLLWLPALYALLNYKDKDQKFAACLFLGACALTTSIFPYLYFTDFVQHPTGWLTWEAPTPLATMVLLTRNLLLIGSFVFILKAYLVNTRHYQADGKKMKRKAFGNTN